MVNVLDLTGGRDRRQMQGQVIRGGDQWQGMDAWYKTGVGIPRESEVEVGGRDQR